MNELIPNFGFIAFVFAGCALGVGLALCQAQKTHRAQLNYLKETLSAELATKKQMQEDFKALLSCSRNIGKKINRTIPYSDPMSTRSEPMISPTPTIRTPLNLNEPVEINAGDKVHELVSHGLSVDEVASVCGLTRGEVDFLSRFIGAGDTKHAA